jgi:hypothetical protein
MPKGDQQLSLQRFCHDSFSPIFCPSSILFCSVRVFFRFGLFSFGRNVIAPWSSCASLVIQTEVFACQLEDLRLKPDLPGAAYLLVFSHDLTAVSIKFDPYAIIEG